MTLVYRSSRLAPLTNDEIDANFKQLDDDIKLRVESSDFNATKISLKLRTTSSGQTSIQLAEANAINAWTVRDMYPDSSLPVGLNKSSLVSRSSDGDVTVRRVYGELFGNASTSTTSSQSTKLSTARKINGVDFDGSIDISITDASKVMKSGDSMSGKLTFAALANAAPVNFGIGAQVVGDNFLVDGDVYVDSTSIYFYRAGQKNKLAFTVSPEFSGVPRSTGPSGAPSQIATIDHLTLFDTTLKALISAKANTESPDLTGSPKSVTPSITSNDKSIATTAFVVQKVSESAAAIQQSTQSYVDTSVVTQSNVINNTLSTKAGIDSPNFSGIPTTPTPTALANDKQIANTEFTRSVINTALAQVNTSIAAVQDVVNATRPVPVASVFYICSTIVPNGYFEANGQAVSRTTYSALWDAMGNPNTGNGSTTFNIPDLRAEFIRGLDNGRGVDTNRQMLSVQYSQNLEHSHIMPGDDMLSLANGVLGWDGNRVGSFAYDAISTQSGSGALYSTTKSGGNESRPRNVALMVIIKW